MRQKSVHPELTSERIVKNIRRATRKHHSSEEKIRIVLDGLRGESSIPELCRRRLAKDWENFNRKALGFLRLASIRLMLRKLSNQS